MNVPELHERVAANRLKFHADTSHDRIEHSANAQRRQILPLAWRHPPGSLPGNAIPPSLFTQIPSRVYPCEYQGVTQIRHIIDPSNSLFGGNH
jgi:hypothetical protein